MGRSKLFPRAFEPTVFEKLPPHAKRVYSLSGGLLPQPRYNIAVNGTWIGEHKPVENYPFLGNIFFPTNWETKQVAVDYAIDIMKSRRSLPGYMGKVDMRTATIEVFECFGSYPQDRAVVWKNDVFTYIYEA